MRCTIRGADVALCACLPPHLWLLREHMEKLESPLSGPVDEVPSFFCPVPDLAVDTADANPPPLSDI